MATSGELINSSGYNLTEPNFAMDALGEGNSVLRINNIHQNIRLHP
jgi:hypothetical protein